MDEDDSSYVRITLRIPREVHSSLEAAARQESHSMNAEIVGRLKQSFASGIEPERVAEHVAQLEQLAAERGRSAEAMAGTVTAFAGVVRLLLAKLPAKERKSPEAQVWSSMADAALHGDARGLAAALAPALAATADGPTLGEEFEIPAFLKKQAEALRPSKGAPTKKRR